ncbi:MAG: PqqD family peptide modification chaperone [Candidatus Methanofastidiosia archaeon]|jgi:radical SAM protein with 4Fe4S-binding SPASM domain
MNIETQYPVIAPGYGAFITPDGGFIFTYKDINGVKSPQPQCKGLNVQACAIIELCTGCNTVKEIVGILDKKFEDTPPDLVSQVTSFLDDIYQEGYIHLSSAPVSIKGLLQGTTEYHIPYQVLLETTTGCNLKCGHCLLSAGNPLKDELSADQFLPILKRFFDMGVKRVELSGGEILTKKRWDKLAEFCKNRFISHVLTNGCLITEETVHTLSWCREIYISVYGSTAQTHEKVTGVKGSFEQVVTGISLLAKKGFYVGVSVIVTPFTLHQFEDIVQLAISLQCKIVRVGIVSPLGRAYDKHWELTLPEKDILDKKIEELKQKYTGKIDIQWEEEESEGNQKCGAGVSRWVVTSNGDVYPCGIFRIPIGNVAREDPLHICVSPAVKFLEKLRPPDKQLCGDCTYFFACKQCHGQAFIYFLKVNHCGWAEQFEKAPEPFKSAIWEKYNQKKIMVLR